MAMFLGLLAAVYAAAWALDRVRGVTPRRSLLASVRALEARHAPDDAPLWAEVVGSVLAPGLFVRAGCHVYAALLDGDDPHVADNDVSAGNAVAVLRGARWQGDLIGRMLAFGAGIAVWTLLDPFSMSFAGPVWVTMGGRAFVALNLGVLVCDPLLFVWYRLRQRHDSYTVQEMTRIHTPDSSGHDRTDRQPVTDGGER